MKFPTASSSLVASGSRGAIATSLFCRSKGADFCDVSHPSAVTFLCSMTLNPFLIFEKSLVPRYEERDFCWIDTFTPMNHYYFCAEQSDFNKNLRIPIRKSDPFRFISILHLFSLSYTTNFTARISYLENRIGKINYNYFHCLLWNTAPHRVGIIPLSQICLARSTCAPATSRSTKSWNLVKNGGEKSGGLE